jgi:hypothetical protein
VNQTEATGPPCPYCESQDTEFFALFGQQLLTSQYYCNSCRTPFERVKGGDVLADATRFVEESEQSDKPIR